MWHGNESGTLTHVYCSFCGKRQDQVTQLTAGPGHLFICNECAEFCREMIEQGHSLSQWREWREWKIEPIEPTSIIESTYTNYEAIRRAVLDYVEGIDEIDATKIECSIHPDLLTRGFLAAQEGSSSLSTLTFAELLEKRNMAQKKRNTQKDIYISDFGDQIATVKLTGWWGTDYLHLAKDQNRWMIVNILRHLHPQRSTWLDNPDKHL